MPKGVEHKTFRPLGKLSRTPLTSLMPKGVEHTVAGTAPRMFGQTAHLFDAERR